MFLHLVLTSFIDFGEAPLHYMLLFDDQIPSEAFFGGDRITYVLSDKQTV